MLCRPSGRQVGNFEPSAFEPIKLGGKFELHRWKQTYGWALLATGHALECRRIATSDTFCITNHGLHPWLSNVTAPQFYLTLGPLDHQQSTKRLENWRLETSALLRLAAL